jgi:hypothetical protein
MFEFFAEWNVVSLTQTAAEQFKRLRKQRIRIATSDLKSIIFGELSAPTRSHSGR